MPVSERVIYVPSKKVLGPQVRGVARTISEKVKQGIRLP